MENIIKRIIDISHISKEGHIASSLSVLDILFVYYESFHPRNKLILSKGHASLGLYAVLEHFNLLRYNLDEFCQFKSKLGGHPSDKIRGVIASTGSLGHGLPIGIGIALGNRIQNIEGNVYVIIGDGEANEGTIWESALLASHHKLNNLFCILDYNRSNDRALKIDNVMDRFRSFNWDCYEINGHKHKDIKSALEIQSEYPVFILSNTIKGKGVELMENNPEWHHKSPNDDEYKTIMDMLFYDRFVSTIDFHPGISKKEGLNLYKYLQEISKIEGDIVEVGVYSGGSAEIINKYKPSNKKLYLFDTFNGWPDGFPSGEPFYDYNYVKKLFENDNVDVIKGIFPDTAPIEFKNKKFSFVHLDLDTYQSTLSSLIYFYDKMTKGGIIMLHDYINTQTPDVKVAVDEFLSDKTEDIILLSDTQAMIVKL
jgi:transketolase